jgi:hypothetical protein
MTLDKNNNSMEIDESQNGIIKELVKETLAIYKPDLQQQLTDAETQKPNNKNIIDDTFKEIINKYYKCIHKLSNATPTQLLCNAEEIHEEQHKEQLYFPYTQSQNSVQTPAHIYTYTLIAAFLKCASDYIKIDKNTTKSPDETKKRKDIEYTRKINDNVLFICKLLIEISAAATLYVIENLSKEPQTQCDLKLIKKIKYDIINKYKASIPNYNLISRLTPNDDQFIRNVIEWGEYHKRDIPEFNVGYCDKLYDRTTFENITVFRQQKARDIYTFEKFEIPEKIELKLQKKVATIADEEVIADFLWYEINHQTFIFDLTRVNHKGCDDMLFTMSWSQRLQFAQTHFGDQFIGYTFITPEQITPNKITEIITTKPSTNIYLRNIGFGAERSLVYVTKLAPKRKIDDGQHTTENKETEN